MKKVFIAVLCGVILFSSYSYAVNLDAPPPEQKKKTIKSEIIRGNNAAMSCCSATIKQNIANKCVLKAIDDERLKGQNNDAFNLGAYCYAWFRADTSSKYDPLQIDMAKSLYRDVARIQKEMGIDDETLAPLISIKPEYLLPKLKEYKNNTGLK